MHQVDTGLRMRMRGEARRIPHQHAQLAELRERVTAEMSRLSLQGAASAFAPFAEALEATDRSKGTPSHSSQGVCPRCEAFRTRRRLAG